MTNENTNGTGKFPDGQVLGTPVRQIQPQSLGDDRSPISSPLPEDATFESARGNVSRVDWQKVLIWIFVSLSFAALAFSGYLIWAKCHGAMPF